MDNSLMYYSPAELEFRRRRAQSARRRRETRSRWLHLPHRRTQDESL